jgi:predicted ATPase
VGVHRVVRATGAVDRLEISSSRRLTPFVGRHDELADLVSAWQHVTEREGVLVHVTGEPGIGKSRLVRTLREQLGNQVRAVQTWQCSAYYQSSPLHPVIRFLERLLGFDMRDEEEHRRQALEEVLRDASIDPLEAAPLLAELLSLPSGDRAVRPALTPRDSRAATMRVLESLLVTNSALHPLLLIVEDLQWADPTTVELLGRMVTTLPALPILCILTFRREFKPPWSNRPAVVDIELERLTAGDVHAMVMATSSSELDGAVLDRVTAPADGVPLFVEEMLKMLDDAGRGDPVAPGATGHGPDPAAIPSTLQGLLTARLDRLNDLREMIDLAAVLGREFPTQLLEALGPFEGGDLEPALGQLAADDVLRPISEGRSRYEFSHALLQEAAYGLLLRRHRQELHARVADVLTRTFPDTADQEPEVVAHHWSCSAETARAVPWWRAAGRRALERAAFLEAADHCRRGLDALEASDPGMGGDVQRVEFLTLLGASLQAGRGYAAPGVETAYERARSGCERLRDQAPLIAVIRGQWMLHLLRAEYPAALDLANEMLALGSHGGHPVRLAEGRLYRGLVHMYRADFLLARQDLEGAFASYERPDPHDQIYEAQGDTGVGALAYLASVLWNLGYTEESRARSDLSLEVAEQVGGPMTRAQAWGMRSLMHLSRGEPVELLHWTDKTRAHSIDRNIGYWRILSSLIRGWLQGRSGDIDTGIGQVRESLDAYLDSGSRLGLPLFSMLLSDLWLAAGDQQRALDALCLGEDHIEATGERFSESELFQLKGKLLMSSGSPDAQGASAAYERAMNTARRQHARLLELRAATRLAAHQRRMGEPCTALEVVESVYGWFGTTSELPDLARARALIAGTGARS